MLVECLILLLKQMSVFSSDFQTLFKLKTESSRKLSNFGSFCRYRKALYFWSLGISLYLELFSFPSLISFVLRNLYSGTHRRNRNFNFQWTKTLYQNNLKNIVLHFTRAKDVICHL